MTDTHDPNTTEVVAVDHVLVADLRRLLSSVTDFCFFADPDAVGYLLDYTSGHLSPDGLAALTRSLGRRLEAAMDQAAP